MSATARRTGPARNDRKRRFSRNGGHSSPDRLRDASHQLELPALLVRRYAVALDGGGEPALRAQGQPFQRHKPRSFLDPPPELFLGLQLRPFCGDKAEYDDAVTWHRLERPEAA